MHVLAHSTTALLYCRPGMEGDCAAEIIERAAEHGIHGWCRTQAGSVEFTVPTPDELARVATGIRFTSLVFPRQWCALAGPPVTLPTSDRATTLAREIAAHVAVCGEVRIEHADSPEGRPLARLARALRHPVQRALADAGVETGAPAGPTLHVFLLAGSEAMLGLSTAGNASPWVNGIPRLKMPRAAPSRSVLKLEEALGLFLDAAERAAWLRPGRRAVDLGAAPGGWSWLLLERGLTVEAVDNAGLAEVVAAHPRLRHWRADGFGFRPSRAVDWLVCDMVERPQRVAALTRDWLARGHCRHAIVNLKLPMKRRWQSVQEHLETIRSSLPRQGRLSARQLYHDREEITVFASREPLAGR